MASKAVTRSESQSQVAGPYWVHEAPSGEQQVKGRHGAIVRRYPIAAKAAAQEHCRRLQAGYHMRRIAMRDAAIDMFDELETIASGLHMLVKAIDEGDPRNELRVRAEDMRRETKTMIAKVLEGLA